MKAIQVVKPGEIKIVDKEIPENIGSGRVLVRTKAAGICASDIHVYHGTSPFAQYPRVIGHEVAGEVVQTGSGVTTLKAGDKVILEPIEYCGKCYACRIGRPNVCENLQVRSVNTDGGFQEYFEAGVDKLHKFPDSMEWEKAVMIEPFTIGAQACFRGDVRENDLVLIYGAGPTGIAVLENAKLRNTTCIVVDINENRLKLAKEFNADYVFNPEKVDLAEEIKNISNHSLCNVVVDAVGVPEIFEQAVTMTSVAGRVVSLGFMDVYPKISLNYIMKKEITIAGSRLQTYQFEKCIKLFSEREINITKLITHVFYYDEVHKAIDLIENHPEEVGKIILKF